MASNLGSKPPRNDCTTTCWRLRSPTSSPASPGRFFTRGAPSSASRPMKQRADPLLAPCSGPSRRGLATLAREARQARRPTLTVPAPGAPLHPQVGTKERPPGTNKGTAQTQEAIDDVINTLTRRGLRENEKRWRIGLPGACEHW